MDGRAIPRQGFLLGRVLGFEIRIDASWFIIFFLLTFSLFAHFRIVHAESGTVLVLGAALVTSLVFFASVLIHELSHSVVARARGMQVRGIRLFVFGGVSMLEDEPERPKDELAMAIVGPLASGVLAAMFYAAALLVPADTLLSGLLGWLAIINAVLAVFNLLPGFPLDGGRVFRAIAWWVTGDLPRATHYAVVAGSTVAYCLIFIGIIEAFLLGAFVAGLWMGFIGWFLLMAARSAEGQMQLRQALGNVRVGDLNLSDCTMVGADEPLSQIIEDHVLRKGERCFLVSRNGGLEGLLTLRDIRSIGRDDWPVTRAADAMVPMEKVRSASKNDSVLDVLRKMDEGGINQVPVVDDGRLEGILTREDLLRLVSVSLELGNGASRKAGR